MSEGGYTETSPGRGVAMVLWTEGYCGSDGEDGERSHGSHGSQERRVGPKVWMDPRSHTPWTSLTKERS